MIALLPTIETTIEELVLSAVLNIAAGTKEKSMIGSEMQLSPQMIELDTENLLAQ